MVPRTPTGRPRARPATGYTYVAVLIWVALVGLGLAVTGELWHTTMQRERETELLFVGEAFRRALNSYHDGSPGLQRFPRTLEALVRDERHPSVQRHLRKIYRDPMTGQAEWGLVRQPDGGIVGVHSLSTAVPLRRGNFKGYAEAFAGKRRYSEWVFRADAAPLFPGGNATSAGRPPAPGSPAAPR